MILGPDKTNRTTNNELRTTIEKPGTKHSQDFDIRNKSKFQAPNSKFVVEFWKLFKFGIVGVSAFLIQFILYFLFTRFLMPGLPKTLVYILAMGFSMTENYTAHRLWTFSDHDTQKGSAMRYTIVVALAAIINAIIFWFGHNIIHIYDLAVVIFAGLAVPFITYAGHRWFTFAKKN